MEKIALVTCYFQPNYGSMLQALATQIAIDKLGYENETIDTTGFNGEIKKAKARYFAKASLTSGIFWTKYGRVRNVLRRKLTHSEYTNNISIRNKRFQDFKMEHFKLSKRYNSIKLLAERCEDEYSSVIVGSDQLWLPGNIAANYFTLDWVPERVNTIAYATSFGQSTLPRDVQKKAAVFLKRIKHISVREKSGQQIVKSVGGRAVPVVCDPTLLISSEEWMAIQQKEPFINSSYIFCYFLGNNSSHREFARKLSRETGCEIIILPHIDEYVKKDEEIGDILLYDIDPGEFINLIRNAKFICTDSFHCTVFSILYKKCFYSFRRFSNTDKRSTNSRLDTLFSELGTENRLLTGDEDIKECIERQINYSDVEKKLNAFKDKSLDYLSQALKNERNTDL